MLLNQNRPKTTPVMAHLTKDLDKHTTTYSYGPNSFKLLGIPAPRPGELLGLLGTHILKPNLGRFNNPPELEEILNHCREKDRHLQSYFTHFLEKQLKVAMKSQHFKDMRGSAEPQRVRKLLEKHNERGMMKEICDDELELNEFSDRSVRRLSGQVLQRRMCTYLKFDEPSSLLDVRQKFKAAQVIRSLLTLDSYVIVADNDISPMPFTVCMGNQKHMVFLAGFDHSRNLRIRDESLIFEVMFFSRYKYPNMSITLGDFKLEVMEGEFTDCQVSVVLGESGSGKTTFLQLLGDMVPPDYEEGLQLWQPKFPVSYKQQIIGWRGYLHLEDMHPAFVRDVMKPLQIEQLLNRKVESLSPGETQRVALTICLGSPASVYLIDEPGAYLDSELRINAAMAIRRHVLRMGKAAIVVEHDLTMATYMADQVIVVDGNVPTNCTTNPPYPLVSGMNRFLPHLDIIYRRNRMSVKHTPRVNKLGSIEDTRQKDAGNYYDVV
ncbi:hypothetical protein ARALYDRAFT_325255 [Arabidopsis lyrata subsp. lyrata]|uniref:ABC transporter domain-containing protein n=1 Tax=Arabidopsis lyrata subsp. lyrata TaxID=81972 RepID=D7LZP5_ARALL|nr:hypothetical protein ARALYDRAFT_325255 [Arabidopsis lyrata subsp. lyrata]